MKAKIRAQNRNWYHGIELFIGSDDRCTVVKEILLERVEPDQLHVAEPSFILDKEQAQTLMDDLWNCGVRPADGTGSAGQLAATQNHLKDMRTIVFKQLKITHGENNS